MRKDLPGEPTTGDAIVVSEVRFRWHRREPLTLDIPTFRVTAGSRLFVKGPSGSGKTTLLNLLGGVLVPEQGSVRVLGTDLPTLSGAQRDAFRSDHIGFIFQMFNLVPYLSLIDNVLLPCRFSPVRRANAQRASGSLESEARRLLGHMELNPDRLDRRGVARLSVGQQQRVAVARALIGGPQLVIADEPTSALDTDNRHRFLDLLSREIVAAGATLLFVSHDPGLQTEFDQALDLADINRATGEVA